MLSLLLNPTTKSLSRNSRQTDRSTSLPCPPTPYSLRLPARLPNHAVNLDAIARIIARHIQDLGEAEGLVDSRVGLVAAALEVAGQGVGVGARGHGGEERTADASALRPRLHGHDVAEVVAVRIVPELRLCGVLCGFPDVVALVMGTRCVS